MYTLQSSQAYLLARTFQVILITISTSSEQLVCISSDYFSSSAFFKESSLVNN